MLRIEFELAKLRAKLKKAVQFYKMWLKWCKVLDRVADKKWKSLPKNQK